MDGKFTLILALAALFLLGALSCPTIAAPHDNPCHPGLHLSKERPLTDKQTTKLIQGLKFWTGFNEIRVDAAGAVTLGDRTYVHASSQTARALITAAVDSQDVFIIENRNQSTAIAFARIEEEFDCLDRGTRYRGWRVKVDFSDFDKLRGDRSVLAAFDPAIIVLHELAHGVLGYQDAPDGTDDLGQCERHINRIRAELGMPQRLHYHAHRDLWVLHFAQIAKTELIFIDSVSESNDQRKYVVWFALNRVIDIDKVRSKH
jgi:hypothetical protein